MTFFARMAEVWPEEVVIASSLSFNPERSQAPKSAMPKNGVKVGRFRIGNATTLGLRRWRLRGHLDRWLHSAGGGSTGWQPPRLVPRAATTTDVAGEYLLLIRAMGTFCALPGIFAYAVPGAIGSGGPSCAARSAHGRAWEARVRL